MKIEKILVRSIQEAIEIIERDYGGNAQIVSSRVVKKRRFKILPFFGEKLLEVVIKVSESNNNFKEVLKEETKNLREDKEKEELYKEIEELKRMVNELMKFKNENLKAELEKRFSRRAVLLFEKMVSRGVSKEIAEKLISDACGYDIDYGVYDFKDEIFNALKDSLKNNIKLYTNFFLNTPKVLALVGPTGVGKTTTIAKLAFHLKKRNKNIGIISLDSFRVGAFDQLKKFAEVLEVPFKVADSPESFNEALTHLKNKETVLVDTAGRSHYDVIKLKELEECFSVSEIHPFLTLAANLSEQVMYEVVSQFSSLPLKGLVFTKLDETPFWGSMINVAYRTQLPILCFTTGQSLPENIVMANYDFLTRLILEEENEVGYSD